MSAAPILITRRAIVAHLKADPAVTAALAAASIFGERPDQDAAYPFSMIDGLESVPGHLIYGSAFIFSKATFTDEVAAIVEAIGTSLDGAVLILSDARRANLTVTATRITRDPREQSLWKGIVSIESRIAKDCDER